MSNIAQGFGICNGFFEDFFLKGEYHGLCFVWILHKCRMTSGERRDNRGEKNDNEQRSVGVIDVLGDVWYNGGMAS